MHRLASLRHRQVQFERQLTAELSSKQPDQEAMSFFEEQKQRIGALIRDIEARPATAPVQRPPEVAPSEVFQAYG